MGCLLYIFCFKIKLSYGSSMLKKERNTFAINFFFLLALYVKPSNQGICAQTYKEKTKDITSKTSHMLL